MSRFLHMLLLLALLTGSSCSEQPPEQAQPKPEQRLAATPPSLEPPSAGEPPPADLPLPKWFETSLAAAPKITQRAVLSTCETWARGDGSCNHVAARNDQIYCWKQRGERALQHAKSLGIRRRRGIDHKIMLLQNLCMELRGWHKKQPTRAADADS